MIRSGVEHDDLPFDIGSGDDINIVIAMSVNVVVGIDIETIIVLVVGGLPFDKLRRVKALAVMVTKGNGPGNVFAVHVVI
jgi:hypothetical protein